MQLTRKRGKDAVTSLQQANRINNLHTRTNYLLARALALAGDAEKAEKKFGEVREADANFVAALNAPETRTRFGALLAEPVPTTPEQFDAFMASERAKYQSLVKASGAKVD